MNVVLDVVRFANDRRRFFKGRWRFLARVFSLKHEASFSHKSANIKTKELNIWLTWRGDKLRYKIRINKCSIENIIAWQSRLLPYVRKTLTNEDQWFTFLLWEKEKASYHVSSIVFVVFDMDTMFELCRFANVENLLGLLLPPTARFGYFGRHGSVWWITVIIKFCKTR